MPSLFFADLVAERSTGTGLGPMPLAGPLPGRRSFAAAVPAGASFHYCIGSITRADQWETGIGQIDAQGRVTRQPLAASGGPGGTDFAPGVKMVALTIAADWFDAMQIAANRQLAMADISGLTAALAGKQPLGNYAAADHVHANALVKNASGHWVAESGRFAMGLAVPASPLHVRGAILNEPLLTLDNQNGNRAQMTSFNDDFYFDFNRNKTTRAAIHFRSASTSTTEFVVQTNALRAGSDEAKSLGLASHRWSVIYASSGTIATSDARAKTDIGAIPDSWLDAWGQVQWCRFRFVGGARWHAGLVAQAVHAAFTDAGLDAFEIGLCCRDAWPAEHDPVTGAEISPAGDRWGLRYDECFAMEAAWQRRELDRLRALIPGEALL